MKLLNNRLIDEMMSIKNYVNNLSDEDLKRIYKKSS
ncbi:MAG: hypothetical protein CM15mP73_5020 [Hyphomicrobiales bacterium]|nr:MAG: hypothetical protein CM15mP73_5020 [Hyphomicrobiales bacterium]